MGSDRITDLLKDLWHLDLVSCRRCGLTALLYINPPSLSLLSSFAELHLAIVMCLQLSRSTRVRMFAVHDMLKCMMHK